MKIRKHYLQYFEAYVLNLPCYLIHELSHYIVALLMIPFLNSFPKFVINNLYHNKITNDMFVSTKSHNMHININSNCRFSLQIFLITFSPAITTILLFIYSPYWLYPYYLCNISTLWLSVGDYRYCKKYIKLKFRKIIKT